MGRPSFSPPHNVEVPIITCWFKNLISLWNRSFKIVQIQSKSNINRKTKQLIERSKHYGGGGERMGRPSLSPPNNVEVPIILLD